MANWSRYYLVVNGKIKEKVFTDELNREMVLVNLIKIADGLPFRIIVVQQKNEQFVIDSRKDKKFINFLYGEI